MELVYNQEWQTQARGSNDSEYQIYLSCADDGNGTDFTTGKPLKTYDEWLNTQRGDIMKTKGEVIRFKLEFMALMLASGRTEHAEDVLQEALALCDTVTEQMPKEAE